MTFTTPILSNNCGHCGHDGALSRCAGCKVMYYCNRDHQTAHRPIHKDTCRPVAKTRETYEKEERDLRALPGDILYEANPFANSVGHFWGILETRPYMRARFGFADALGQVDTRAGVEANLEHLMDMLRLCRGDNMGVRGIIPGLMLRVGKDQECYDFAKWWSTVGAQSDYDWGDVDLPYLDIRNANSFEDVGYLCRKYVDVSHVVAVVLLKIRLLLDLNTLQNLFIQTQGKSPDEIQSIIRQPFEARSSIVASKEDGWKLQDHSEQINMIASQIKSLIPAVDGSNRHFWKMLVNGKEADPPGPYALGSPEHAELVLLYSRMSWIETPGAIEVLKEML